MARAEIAGGICGFTTRVKATATGPTCKISIESECEAIKRLAEQLREVDPFREITYRGDGPLVVELASEFCRHPACPVPVGILKAVEIETGLALPADVTIRLFRSDGDD